MPLNSMSDWGWHNFKNTSNLKMSETEKVFDFGHGHPEIYAVEYKNRPENTSDGTSPRNIAATEYFRINPHRLNLGTVGLELRNSEGTPIAVTDLKSTKQTLHLWDGEIESTFQADGETVEVSTGVHPTKDALYARIKSNLLKDQRARIVLRFSYPTGKHADDANDWTKPELHQSAIISKSDNSALIEHILDDTKYYVLLQWEGNADLKACDRHHFELTTNDDVLTISTEYLSGDAGIPDLSSFPAYEYDQHHKATLRHWSSWWNSGAFIDFSGCTDPRAKELERRVILSQYLTQINCANKMPPQETGLTYNSWFGRPHLEMTWWHIVDFALWRSCSP